MANTYRNGAQIGAVKVDRPLSGNSNTKSSSFSLKSKPSVPVSNSLGLRRTSTGSLGNSTAAVKDDARVIGRVRVAVRLRPRNAEELVADADFAVCVELQPEVKTSKKQMGF